MKKLVLALLILLVVLHHDFWWWSDRTVLFGFLPVGLAWHAGISVAAGLVGWLAVTFCWPQELEGVEEEPAGTGSNRRQEG